MTCPVCNGTGRVVEREWFPTNEKYELGDRMYGRSRPAACGHCSGTGHPRPRRQVSSEDARRAFRMMSRFLRVTGATIDPCALERQLDELA